MTSRIVALALVTGAVLTAAREARAQSCAYPQPIEVVDTGDTHYDSFIDQSHINRYWSDFALDVEDWDENWGYHDPANLTLPFARAMTAFWALENSAPPGAGRDNFLTWAYRFSKDAIDEIRTECTLDFTARTQHPIDNWTKLGVPFFYHLGVPERASTVVHEARHADGKRHNDCRCDRQRSCDTNWQYNGANTYQVIWLEWFMHTAVNTTPRMHERARDRANEILGDSFCTDPGFRL